MRKIFTFLFAALMSVGMWAAPIVAVPNPSSSYTPTQIVNGSFEATPTMAGPKQNRIPNGTNQGWNTTENGDVCFEWMSSMKNHNPNLSPIGIYCVEMNADNSAALYQDLYTYGGDVIRWSLAHAVRNYACGPAEQYMRVEVGAPLYNGNNIVYPTGVNNNINTNINSNTKATYRYNGITNPTGHTYGFNGQNLGNLKLNKSANANQWYYATGVYIVPESQPVTRFAFVSEDNSSCGNLLDDISFSTLIGDLSATYGANNSVVIKGYWGETDSSKKLIININGTPNEVDMTSVRGQNFVITMTYDNNPTSIMVYHKDYVSATRTLSIAKGNPTVTAPTAKANLTYSGSAQALVNAGSTTGGTMQYKVGSGSWGTSIPTGTNAGSYTVYYKVVGNSNYNGNNGSNFQVTIAKANPTVTAPTAKANLTYSGSAQALVNAGSTNGGTMKYSLDNSTWNTDIPTGTNAGSYTVYYKVEGNSNYNGNNGSNFQVTIAKSSTTTIATVPAAIENLEYTGDAQPLATAGSSPDGTMMYSLDGTNWSEDIPTGTAVGDYTVYYYVKGDANHNDGAVQSFNVSIAEKASAAMGDSGDNTVKGADISSFLDAQDGHTIENVAIVRPVYRNTYYNTLCLPFDLPSLTGTILDGFKVMELSGISVSGGTLHVELEEATSIVAGKPYFVKYEAETDILSQLDFTDVTINNANLIDNAVTIDGVTFRGTFAPYAMEAQTEENHSYLFLGQNDVLYWPNANGNLLSFRAFFVINTGANNSPIRRGMPARIVEGKNVATGVENANLKSEINNQKFIKDGQLIIIRNGVEYNANGQIVK